jgi:hypothetical protein
VYGEVSCQGRTKKTARVSTPAQMKSSRLGKNPFSGAVGVGKCPLLSSEKQYSFSSPALSRFLEWRIIANSLTERCGHKTFQIFWVLGGLRANRTLPVVFRVRTVGGRRRVIDQLPTNRELVTIRTSSVDPGLLDVLRLIRPRFFAVIQRADWSYSFTNLSLSAFWWMLNVRG